MRRANAIQKLLPLCLLLILLNALVVVAQQGDAAGTTYEVREPGETILSVAARFEKPAACIRLANDLQPLPLLKIGQQLFIPDDCNPFLDAGGGAEVLAVTPTAESMLTTPAASATPTPAIVQDQTYVVVAGDRLAKIAEAYSVTLACLVRANRIANPDLIYVGQQLLISANCQGGGGGADTGGADTSGLTCQFDRYAGRTAPNGTYIVRAGDTLDFIACDFGLSLQCLRESNPQVVNHKRLAIGDALTINLGCPPWDGAIIPAG